MSSHALDSQLEEKYASIIAGLEKDVREIRTLQTQGENAIQIGYTPDQVFTINMAPSTGLIGTFICTLQYDDPVADSVVFADLDIGVNKGTDLTEPPYALDPYTGGLRVEQMDSQFFVKSWYTVEGYYPKVKIVKLYTYSSMTPDNFHIHCRWRYAGVGKILLPVTGDISILP